MTLLERGVNAVQVVYTNLIKKLYFDPIDQAVMEKALGAALPPVAEMARNTSLLLVNTFHALTLPRPHAVGVVEVGGIHITRPDPAPLPKVSGDAVPARMLTITQNVVRSSKVPRGKQRTPPQKKSLTNFKKLQTIPEKNRKNIETICKTSKTF